MANSVAIINCDLDSSPETNGAHILQREIPGSVIVDVCNGERLDDVGSHSHYIITGSRASHDERAPWADHVRQIICEINRTGKPCLGICFGMQIAAACLGGVVEKGAVDEQGFSHVRIAGESPLLAGSPPSFQVFQYRHDAVTLLPRGSHVLLESDSGVQAFVLRNFLCVQFHPEVSPSIACSMARRDGLDVERVLNGVRQDYAVPFGIVERFVSIAQGAERFI